MIPSDIKNTIACALGMQLGFVLKDDEVTQAEIDEISRLTKEALLWLEAQEVERIQASYSQESVKTFNNQKEQEK